ncbi:MAG: hypothetical protein MUC56_00135 [Thermoanaerobaculales bacterium]|jgi:hypothetical protein|nr:hypothetical protein [Thermoanaerobaculales bacterium]
MKEADVHGLSERYTELSDRFRSLWTFFQFLAGVYKHRGDGAIPYDYDFQALYQRIQNLVPQITGNVDRLVQIEFETIERELERIRGELERLEKQFGPSYLRRFFDHLKRQDEKILFALVKFYLMSKHLEQETFDKLDILLTRLAEAPSEGEVLIQRARPDLLGTFERLAAFSGIAPLPPSEEKPLIDAVSELRDEFERIGDFDTLVQSKVYDRLRGFKTRIGRAMLHPPVLFEITAANIAARNRFRDLFDIEERQLLEGTNRIFDIERYLKKNPNLASDEIKEKIEIFRESRVRFEDARRQHNVKRSDILDLRQSMHDVLAHFESTAADLLGNLNKRPGQTAAPRVRPLETRQEVVPQPVPPPPDQPSAIGPPRAKRPEDPPITSITDLLPSDPLLNEVLHKIMFALELVVWDRTPEQVIEAPEIKRLGLEAWEVETYRNLVEGQSDDNRERLHLQQFFLTSAALRVKMEEERREIERLAQSGKPDLLFEMLEESASSLDRAREVERRFLWFIDDMLYRADTEALEQIYRSRFRFLFAFAGLWLDHQKNGGLTPL